jgi:hypothetical protein
MLLPVYTNVDQLDFFLSQVIISSSLLVTYLKINK